MTRDEFRTEFTACFLCGAQASDVHEIARGPNRQKALLVRAAWIRCCSDCHHRRLDGMPVARQLAYKALGDPCGYSREEVNALRNRAPNAVSEKDVITQIADIVRKTCT
jgi:hypothetical protein